MLIKALFRVLRILRQDEEGRFCETLVGENRLGSALLDGFSASI